MKLDSLVAGGFSALGPRVSLIGVLPTLLLFLLIAGLLGAGAPAEAPRVKPLLDAIDRAGTGEAVVAAALLFALAVLTQPLQLGLVRLMEGYWGDAPGARALARASTARQARRRAALVERTRASGDRPIDAATLLRMQSAAATLLQRYPPETRLMPTALGNALRAAELRPLALYGLDGVAAWPRLYPLLPEPLRAMLADARNQLDVALRLAAMFALAAVVSAALLWWHGAWLLLPLACAALAWLSYVSGVQAAIAYGAAVAVAFDLHRFSLIAALRLPLPADADEERRMNERVSAFLRQGSAVGVGYVHPPVKS